MAIDLVNVAAGIGGFVIHGEEAGDGSGFSVWSAGDINGDGFDDLVIGARWSDGPLNGRADAGDDYVIFGKAGGFAAAIDLADIAAGIGGFVIHGQDAGDYAGFLESSAGDINGDGFDDLLIGAANADGPGNGRAGAGDSYVVFGHAGSFGAQIDLASVAAGIGGFVIHGAEAGDGSGAGVSAAGDLNGDGYDDLVIGGGGGDGPANTRSGAGDTYVIYGHAGSFAAALDLAVAPNGTNGFIIHGEETGDFSGQWVASAGDINGDGHDDLAIGAIQGAGPANTRSYAGGTYVVFGQAGGLGASVDLVDIAAGNGGFVIHGQDSFDFSGTSLSSAGDINGDGFDDLAIAAFGGDGPGNGRAGAGDSYVVFGKAGSFGASVDLVNIAAGVGGFVIHGAETGDSAQFIASAGDVNGDGFDDLIVGAWIADGPANARDAAGGTYVVFGKAGGFAAAIDLASVEAGAGGFVIHGEEDFDNSGVSVSSAGDIDGDGFDDLIIGAQDGDGPANGRTDAGDSYVLFGSATLGGSGNHVTHAGTAGNDILNGTNSADVMVGGRGDDIFLGNDGTGLGGLDTMRGGQGNDTFTIAGAVGLFRIEGGTGNDVLAFSGPPFSGGIIDTDFRRIDGIESLRLGTGAMVMVIGQIAERAIDGLAANNFQIVIDGALTTNAVVSIDGSTLDRGLTVDLSGNAASVNLRGGSGNDILSGGAGADTVIGNGGNDIVSGGGGIDTFIAASGAGNDIYNGGSGIDTIRFSSALQTVTVNLGAGSNQASGAEIGTDQIAAVENVEGGKGNDTITGNGAANALDGGLGNDTLNGRTGDDTLTGGAGDISSTGGNDTLNGEAGNDALAGGGGNDNLNGGDGNDAASGEFGDDTLTGGTGADALDGGLGTDTASYSAAAAGLIADLLLPGGNTGDAAGDSYVGVENVTGSAFNDSLRGDHGANKLSGNNGNDALTGRGGDDALVGGLGNDLLNGGMERDVLTGGAGIDRFDFNFTTESGTTSESRDIVADFVHLTDIVDLLTIDAIAGGADDAFAYIGTAGFTAAGQARVFQSGANTIIELNTSGTSGAEAQIRLTAITATTLTGADFVL